MLSLLKLKHWHIFILTFGILIAAMTVQSVATALNHPMQDIISRLAEFFSTLTFIIASAWFYAMGAELYKKLPREQRFNLGLFRFNVVVPLTYSLVTTLIPGFAFLAVGKWAGIFTLLTLVCGVVNDIFIAGALVSVETRKPAGFAESIREFFMLFFYPVGVWWIQPRMNEIFDAENFVDRDAPLDRNLIQ
jgi:hypothetical protein